MKKFVLFFCFIINICVGSVVFAQEKNYIYIYQDEGVGEESFLQTIATFKNLLKHYPVKSINAEELKEGIWTKNARLFVMPGGADLPYVKKLNGKGNAVLKQYVEEGGAFLGICAGSYYASSYVEFDKNGSLEVLGDRELAFFKGKAIGPILAPYDYKTQSGSRAATIHTIFNTVPETIVFYNGGGFFEKAEQYPNTQVIARYQNNLPAIIFVSYGKGKVVLSGVHVEYDPALLNAKDIHIQKIIEPLREGDLSRKILFQHIMQLLGVQE